MTRRQKGFSLIELLIVVAIILIIAAIAIPNLLRSRISANEASAIASMRTIVTSEIIYSSTFTLGYSGNLNVLSDGGSSANCFPPAVPATASACLIDTTLASGVKSGYTFTYAPTGSGGSNSTYTLNADPIVVGSSGQRHFYTDGSNVIRMNFTTAATVSDPAI